MSRAHWWWLVATFAVAGTAWILLGQFGAPGDRLRSLPAADTEHATAAGQLVPVVPPTRATVSADASGIEVSTGELHQAADAGETGYSTCTTKDREWNFAETASRIVATLSRADNAEHLLVAALVNALQAGGIEPVLLARAMAADATHPLVNWSLANFCGANADSALCLNPGYVRRVTGVDGTNGALWAQIAMNHLDAGNDEAALAAMRQANTAPEFSFYTIEHVLMFERGFASASDLSYAERVDQAMAATEWLVPAGARVLAACRDRAPHSAEWQVQCLRFGQRLEREGDSYQAVLVGLGIQQLALELGNDAYYLVGVRARFADLQREFADEPGRSLPLPYLLDDRVAEIFVDEWLAHGELLAHRTAREEYARLQAVSAEQDCPLQRR